MTRAEKIAAQKSQIIRIREYSGTYIATGGGMRATNTRGPQQAAHGLALKLFAHRPFNLTALAEANAWRAVAAGEGI
jgi:hypothetical protein